MMVDLSSTINSQPVPMKSIPTMNWSTAVPSRYSRMKILAFTLLSIVAMLMAPPALSQIVGTARVTDGDTIIIQGHRIRLHGIDAPESQQTCRSGTTIWHCGRSSTNALNERLSGYPVSCHARAQDRYGRTIAVCTVSGEDINAWLVSQGWALAYRKYSLDYTAHEDLARSHRRGIWSSEFIPPWRWRRGERL